MSIEKGDVISFSTAQKNDIGPIREVNDDDFVELLADSLRQENVPLKPAIFEDMQTGDDWDDIWDILHDARNTVPWNQEEEPNPKPKLKIKIDRSKYQDDYQKKDPKRIEGIALVYNRRNVQLVRYF